MHKKDVPAFMMAMVGIVGGFLVWMNTGDAESTSGSGAKNSEIKPKPPIVIAKKDVPKDYQTSVDFYFDRLKEVSSNLSYYRLYDLLDTRTLQDEYRWIAPNTDIQKFQQFETDGQTVFFSFDQKIYVISTKGALSDLRNVLGEVTYIYLRDADKNDAEFSLVLRTILDAFYSGYTKVGGTAPYFNSSELHTVRAAHVSYDIRFSEKTGDYAKVFEDYVKSDQSTVIGAMLKNMVREIIGQVQATQESLLAKGQDILEGDDLEVGYRNFTGVWYSKLSKIDPDVLKVPANLTKLWSTVDSEAIESNPVLFGGKAAEHGLSEDVGFKPDGLVGERDDAFKIDLVVVDEVDDD